MRNLYEILGVNPGANADEIRAAYRQMSKATHPDVNPDPDATERFKEVQSAFDILSDPQKRKAYDEGGDADSARQGMTRIETMLKASISVIIQRAAPNVNLLDALRGQIQGAMLEKTREIESARHDLARLRKLSGKCDRPEGGVNIFETAIREAIASRELQVEICLNDLDDGAEMTRYLDGYEFNGGPIERAYIKRDDGRREPLTFASFTK